MKKFSLLIALCLILTIGGVYAAWIYSGTGLGAQTEPFVSKMGILDHDGDAGTYTFTNNSLDFSIEPNNQQEKITTLVWGEGSMTLVFTPKVDISDTALENALTATITIEQASATLGSYNGETIYTVNSDFKIVLTENSWTPHDNNADGVTDYYTYTITKANVEGSVSVGQFHLPTEDDYNEFKTAIQDVKFRVKVTPKVTTPTTPAE